MKMRNSFGVVLMALMAMGLYSCSDDLDNNIDNGLRTGKASKIELTKDAKPVSELQFSMGRGTAVIGIEADGRARMQFLPVLHQHTILHDDVVAATDELMNLHIARLIVEREPETDVEQVASGDRGGMVGK